MYGEDLCGAGEDRLIRKLNPAVKEKVLAGKVNLILILAEGTGPAAEVSELAQFPEVCLRMVVALHENEKESYLAIGPVRQAEAHGAKVIFFTDADLTSCALATRAYDRVIAAFENHIVRLIGRRSLEESFRTVTLFREN